MLRKIVDRITKVNLLKEEISDLKEQLREQRSLIDRLVLENEEIKNLSTRLADIESDRDELFRRTGSLESAASDTSDRMTAFENDRDELFKRSDRIQSGISVLESDRDELFRRTGSLESAASDTSDRMTVFENDRDELFKRSDRIQSGISVLENDRTELFSRVDEIRSIIDRIQIEGRENVLAAETGIRASLDNIRCMIIPGKELPVIHFIRIYDIKNTGDKSCGPYEYFRNEFSRYNCVFHTLKDIRFDLIHKDDFVILGGGGILDSSRYYDEAINCVLSVCDNVICWSAGHNIHDGAGEPVPRINYAAFKLLATRDYGYSEDEKYCPCVSCMMKGLDMKLDIKRKIGVISHHEIPIDEFREYERMTNSDRLEDILKFIGESEVIITNAFHCSYWATLMGKKVILYKPFSTRFRYLKYSPTVYSGDLEADVAAAGNYMNALEECRKINVEFMGEVIKFIEQGRK